MKEGVKKKGISPIAFAAILVGTVLIITVIFGVINAIRYNDQEPDFGMNLCINTDVEATSVNCINVGVSRICDVTLQRSGTGTDAIGGVKLVFKNTTAGTSSGLITSLGNIEPSIPVTKTGINTTLSTVNKVEVTAYFKDESGNDWICGQTNSFTF